MRASTPFTYAASGRSFVSLGSQRGFSKNRALKDPKKTGRGVMRGEHEASSMKNVKKRFANSAVAIAASMGLMSACFVRV